VAFYKIDLAPVQSADENRIKVMTKIILIAGLLFLIGISSCKQSQPLAKALTKGYWHENTNIYNLNIRDTLRLTRVEEKKGLKFKNRGIFKSRGIYKGWQVNGLCGNASMFERLFTKKAKWKKLGNWVQIDSKSIAIYEDRSSSIETFSLLDLQKDYIELIRTGTR
jgi:hypothetical protein